MPNTRTPSISSEVPIGRRINGSEMLIAGRPLSCARFGGSASRDSELPNRLIDTVRLGKRSGPAVVFFLSEGKAAFDPVEDVDHAVARRRRHAGKGFLANCFIDADNLRDNRPGRRGHANY